MVLFKNRICFYFIAFILSAFFSISCSENKIKNEKHKNVTTNTAKEIVIFFKLKKNEKCIFNYVNSFFEGKQVVFSNPGNTDTVISKSMYSEMPLIFTYGLIGFTESKNNNVIIYTIFAKPGDTIRLSYANNFYLNDNGNNKTTFLTDSSTSFYSKNYSGKTRKELNSYKKIDWEIYYSTFNKDLNMAFDIETKRINKQLEVNKIDSTIYLASILNSKIHYYKTIFNLIEADMQYPKLILPYTLNKVTEIENILKSKNIFLSNEITTLIYGMLQIKLINKNNDYLNNANIYREAISSDLGNFKPSFLSRCIYFYKSNKDSEFNKVVSDFKERYLNTEYFYYVDSLLMPKNESINTADNVITLKNEKQLWSDLINGDTAQFTVIDFWASWCSPCRQQFPILDRLKAGLKKYSISFISINIDEDKDDWIIASEAERKYLSENNYHLIDAKNSAIIKKLGISSIPRILVLKKSKIISSNFYTPSESGFTRELIKLMKE